MSGYVFVTSECYCCHNLMAYNPHKVPSIRINGIREPVCRSCIERVNPMRVKNGLAPIEILPGAYESIPEEEL